MANIPFKSITFPGLPNKYTVPEISNDLMTAGKAADAKATGDALSALEDQFTEETDQLKADLGGVTGTREIQWVVGSYISLVSVGSTVSITPIADTSMAHAIVPCKKGERITITLTPGSLGVKKTMGFFDSSYVCTWRYSFADAISDVTLNAPNDGYFIANALVSAPHKLFTGIVNSSDFVDACVSNMEGIYSTYGNRTALAYTTETGKVYRDAYPNGTTVSGYNTYAYSVKNGDILSISAQYPSSLSYKLAMFYDSSNRYIGCIERVGTATIQSDVIITVPPNSAVMRISLNNTFTPSVSKFSMSGGKRVSVTSDTVVIENDTAIITMKKRGNNNLFDFYSIANKSNVALLTAGTDWQGPYIVSAVNNADGDAISEGTDYTGGNHAYADDGASGTPTARTVGIHVYADGVEVLDGEELEWHDYVDVIWTNYVQAWNTKKADGTGREVIKEMPHWQFLPDGRVETSNFITALEDVTVGMYYGLQMQGIWAENGVYLPSASRAYVNMSDFTPAGLGTKFPGCEASAIGDNLTIKMGFDPLIDLGTGSGITSDTLVENRIHTSTSKMYIYMMYGLTLHSNEHAEYKGYYKFIMT